MKNLNRVTSICLATGVLFSSPWVLSTKAGNGDLAHAKLVTEQPTAEEGITGDATTDVTTNVTTTEMTDAEDAPVTEQPPAEEGITGAATTDVTTTEVTEEKEVPVTKQPTAEEFIAEVLQDAVRADEVSAVRQMLEARPDLIRKLAPEGLTLLHLAAQTGALKVARFLLLEKGVDVEQRCFIEDSPFFRWRALNFAVDSGNVKMITLLMKEGRADDSPLYRAALTVQEIPLFQAIIKGDPQIVLALIENGASPNAFFEKHHIKALELALLYAPPEVVEMASFFSPESDCGIPILQILLDAGAVPPSSEEINYNISRDAETKARIIKRGCPFYPATDWRDNLMERCSSLPPDAFLYREFDIIRGGGVGRTALFFQRLQAQIDRGFRQKALEHAASWELCRLEVHDLVEKEPDELLDNPKLLVKTLHYMELNYDQDSCFNQRIIKHLCNLLERTDPKLLAEVVCDMKSEFGEYDDSAQRVIMSLTNMLKSVHGKSLQELVDF
jgi:hypothetical protein